MSQKHSNGNDLGYLLAKHRRVVAFTVFACFAIIFAFGFAVHTNSHQLGTPFDWFDIAAFIVLPTLIACLFYITLRSVAEKEQAQTLVQAILEDAPIGILTTDPNGRVNSVNAAFLSIMAGAERDHIVGRLLSQVPHVNGTALQEYLERGQRGEPFALTDFEYASPKGQMGSVSAYGVPLRDRAGNPEGLLLLMEDTSERRRWRNELQARSELAQRRSHELEILQEISLAISSTLDIDEILRVTYERTSALVNGSTFFIALYDEPTQELHFEFLVDNGIRSPKMTRRVDTAGGLSAWILKHREPLLIGDLQTDGSMPVSPGVIGSPARSWLGVPLIAGDRAIGVMSVQSYSPNQFDDAHLRMLSAIGNEISIVIENARLFAQIRARAEELSAANEIALAINSTLNLDELLQLFFDRLTGLFNVEAGALVLLDPTSDQLVFEVVHGGAGDSLLHKRMRRDEGIVGWVTLHGESLLVPDVQHDSRWFKGIDRDTRFITHSILAAPIKVQDRTIGAVELVNRRDGRPFAKEDEKLLGMFAASAGIAIENARLHRQTEKRLAEVTTLNLIANQLATSLDLDEILNSIAGQLRSIFNCRACAIHLLDVESKMVVLKALSGPAHGPDFHRLSFGRGIVGRVASQRTPVYIQSASEVPSNIEFDPAVQSMLIVPVSSRERVLGTLSLDGDRPHAFSEDDQRLLTTVAAQLATAVENAQLYADLKERAQRLKQAFDELQELDRLKTEFVQNVSHELRTPLTFIKGYVELLRADMMGPLPGQVHEGLDTVANKTDALIRLVNDILSLRAETGKLHLAPVNVGMLARATVHSAMFSAAQSKIELCEEIAAVQPEIFGDAERIVEVFENLIENAIKFSPNGGAVTVCVDPHEEGVLIRVQDHGIGIPEDQLDKIFDRFYQVDGSATRNYGGTGLGLAIVKEIVQAHHGRVWATSQLGKGSVFHIILPKGTPSPDPTAGL